MNQQPAQEAIAALMELAQQGEIDPWNVKVIEIIDRFLIELGLIGKTKLDSQENDLAQSGQTFLWASKLVLFKAETLEQLMINPEAEIDLDDAQDLDIQLHDHPLPRTLENYLRRRSVVTPLRKRRVTLQELIEQIQQIAAEIETVPKKTPSSPHRLPSKKETAKIIVELAHEENLTEIASYLENFFLSDFLPLAEKKSFNLEELLVSWSQSDNYHSSVDRVGLFWALLLLSSQSKVELYQQEFYQDLTITPIVSNLDQTTSPLAP